MERHGDKIELTTTEARAGGRPRSMTIVLIVSVLLAIMILSAVWIAGALRTDSVDPGAVVGGLETPAA